jgi:predicted NBD/HSP70 family sugar kinase
MYLGIDIGGTKTLVATLDSRGVIDQRIKFPTPADYAEWRVQLAVTVDKLSTKKFIAVGVGAPGRIDRERGVGLDMGNLPWHHTPIKKDVEALLDCPVVVDNDANLAGLSEAMLIKQYDRVLYVTISTGIGTGFIVGRAIEPSFEEWEDFASGRAIFERYSKPARDITDPAAWRRIAKDISIGLIDLIAVVQPQAIVLGGSIGTYYDRYREYLSQALNRYATPLVPIPPVMKASRPEEAVVYGCYDLAKSVYGSTRK